MKRSDSPDFFEAVPAGCDTGLPDEKVRAVLEEIKAMGFVVEVTEGGLSSYAGGLERVRWPDFKCKHCFEQARRLVEEVFGGSYN